MPILFFFVQVSLLAACGLQLRSANPAAMKDFVLAVHERVAEASSEGSQVLLVGTLRASVKLLCLYRCCQQVSMEFSCYRHPACYFCLRPPFQPECVLAMMMQGVLSCLSGLS